jgi:Cu/Ag efflux protein CusF
MAHDAKNDVHAPGTVNSVDPAGHKINVTHQPIPQIGWPTMTMDFTVAPAVDLRAIKPGSRVEFSMMQGPDGMYQIQSIVPAGAGR